MEESDSKAKAKIKSEELGASGRLNGTSVLKAMMASSLSSIDSIEDPLNPTDVKLTAGSSGAFANLYGVAACGLEISSGNKKIILAAPTHCNRSNNPKNNPPDTQELQESLAFLNKKLELETIPGQESICFVPVSENNENRHGKRRNHWNLLVIHKNKAGITKYHLFEPTVSITNKDDIARMIMIGIDKKFIITHRVGAQSPFDSTNCGRYVAAMTAILIKRFLEEKPLHVTAAELPQFIMRSARREQDMLSSTIALVEDTTLPLNEGDDFNMDGDVGEVLDTDNSGSKDEIKPKSIGDATTENSTNNERPTLSPNDNEAKIQDVEKHLKECKKDVPITPRSPIATNAIRANLTFLSFSSPVTLFILAFIFCIRSYLTRKKATQNFPPMACAPVEASTEDRPLGMPEATEDRAGSPSPMPE